MAPIVDCQCVKARTQTAGALQSPNSPDVPSAYWLLVRNKGIQSPSNIPISIKNQRVSLPEASPKPALDGQPTPKEGSATQLSRSRTLDMWVPFWQTWAGLKQC